MAAPAGTLTYNTVVTMTAPGSSNADATLIASAFNGQIFPYVSNSAAVASATTSAVTITWAQAAERIPDQMVRDFVAAELVALKASLNAPVTAIAVNTLMVLT